jgi:hypothetical protein
LVSQAFEKRKHVCEWYTFQCHRDLTIRL